MSDEDTDKRGPHDEDRTPVRGAPPEHLPPAEAKRIERIFAREPEGVHMAMAGRLRAEGVDLHVVISQVATDVDRMKVPVGLAKKLAMGVAASSVGIILFVAYVVSDRTRTDTAVEYRLRALESACVRIESALDRLNPRRTDYPVASSPAGTKGPTP